MNIAELNVVIGAEISDFEKKIQHLEKGIGKLGDKLKGAGESLTTYFTAPLTLLGAASLKAAGDMQALEKGFNAVYKGAGVAADELAKVKEVAKLPGLGLKEAIQGSINLQAAGFSAEQARSALTGFGNALATVGKGKADLDGVTAALSQMAAKGKISAEEINQISERVPQIRKVMQQAFGTGDTEVLSKMGIGVDEFVSKVTTELNKLPPVSGGINNAFENMADTGLLAFSTLGGVINKTFNIEGLFGSVADSIAGVVKWFEALTPAGQKTILIIGGLTAAAGPLLLAVGGIISALPFLIAGFTAVTGPIGLAVAAVAAGAILLISNWDAVVSYFKSSGLADVFSGLKDSVSETFSALVGYVQDFASLVKPIWDGVIEIFSSGLGNALKLTGVVLGAAFDVLTRILKTFSAVFRGDWAGVWQGIGNIVISVLNGINKIFTGFASHIIKTLASLGKVVLGDEFGKSLNKGAASVDAFGKSLQLSYMGVDKLADNNKKAAQSFTEIAKEADVLNQTFARTPKEVKVKVKIEKIGKVDELDAQIAEEIKKIKPASVDGFSVGSLIKVPKMEPLGKDAGLSLPPDFEKRLAAAQTGMIALKGTMIEMAGFMQSELSSAFLGVGDLISQAFTGNIGGAEGFFKGILSIVIDFVGQFGKLLIGAGVAALNFKNLLVNPIAAIAAGVALVAISGMVGGLLKKGPSGGGGGGGGGSSYKPPTTNARTESFTGPNANNGGTVAFEIDGTKLVGVLRKQGYKDGR